MAKWLCFVVAILLLVPNIGANEKRVDEKDENNMKENDMQHFNNFHHSFLSNFIHRIFLKMKNYAPVALMKSCEGIVGKSIVFDASPSYDPNGDALKYRWDFDNDGIYDTPWMTSPKAMYVYPTPYNGFVKLEVKDEHGLTDECITRVAIKNTATAPTTGEVDQSQEKADGFVKIYEDRVFAQSFRPSKCGLDGMDLLIARKGILSNENNAAGKAISRLAALISKFLGGRMVYAKRTSIFLGELIVGIYGKLGDIFSDEEVRKSKIFEKRLKPDEIERTATWIHIDLDAELEWNKTYYIVVYQDGGNQWQYYKWYYGTGNPYDGGEAYQSSWADNWHEYGSNDFCFRTYAHETGDEPDGIVEKWAVLIGCLEVYGGEITYYADQDAYDARDCLIAHGWSSDHIRVSI